VAAKGLFPFCRFFCILLIVPWYGSLCFATVPKNRLPGSLTPARFFLCEHSLPVEHGKEVTQIQMVLQSRILSEDTS